MGSVSVFFAFKLWILLSVTVNALQISIPSSPPSHHSVQQNFLGLSFELSFVDLYFGDDTSSIPPNIINYLTELRARTGSNPLRLRIGGNSMDTSIYNRSISTPMIQKLAVSPFNYGSRDDQSVSYGPVLWEVLSQVSAGIGNAIYLVGLSLLNPGSADIAFSAGDAAKTLGSNLDGFLLGNEPDLYSRHELRPNLQNYTTTNYMNDWQEVINHLKNTSDGNVVSTPDLGGPTICCEWNLDAVLDAGFAQRFNSELKYISLQHYPQNICKGTFTFGISHYVQHANVVSLAQWQIPGVQEVITDTNQQLILSEFNSAACGGIPNVSNSFGVGSLWTADYALQLASIGYSAAYIHSRERGVAYNLFTPPVGSNGAPGPWTTGSPYYGVLATLEALRSETGSIVVDLNVANSMTDASASVSGYAIYDAKNLTVQQLALFNFADTLSSAKSTVPFVIPANTFPSELGPMVTVKFLHGFSLEEQTSIAWGGQTLAHSGNGTLLPVNASWAPQNIQLNCKQGCTVHVPSPGMALVLAGSTPSVQAPFILQNTTTSGINSTSVSNDTNNGTNGGSNGNNTSDGSSQSSGLPMDFMSTARLNTLLSFTLVLWVASLIS